MKKIKKLLAMIMAMTMVLGMAMTVSAAPGDPWTISISGTGIDADAEDLTVNFGQIVAADPTSPIGWKFADDLSPEQVQAFINAWNQASSPAGNLDEEGVLEALKTLGLGENPENDNVEKGIITTSSQLSAALAAVTDVADESMDITMGADVKEAGAGLYIVVAHRSGYTYLPMAAYMNSEGEPVTVVAKGSEDQLKKTVEDTGISVAPGDEVIYTIKQQYLYIEPHARDKEFTISDAITNGTIDMSSLSVGYANTADGQIIGSLSPVSQDNPDGDYQATPVTTPEVGVTGFTLDFGGDYYDSSLAGKMLVITYKVVVGALSADTVTTVSNQASSSNGTGQIVVTEPVSFTVTKIDSEKQSEKLGGAVFTIYKEVPAAIENVTTTITYGGEEKNVIVVDTITTASEGDAKGTATINNLDAQATYYVKETNAPTGYSLNDTVFKLSGAQANAPITDSVEKDNVKYETTTYTFSDFNGITVDDTKLASLPSTGGIGTTIFTIGGCAIMIAAAALYFVNRRKSEEN